MTKTRGTSIRMFKTLFLSINSENGFTSGPGSIKSIVSFTSTSCLWCWSFLNKHFNFALQILKCGRKSIDHRSLFPLSTRKENIALSDQLQHYEEVILVCDVYVNLIFSTVSCSSVTWVRPSKSVLGHFRLALKVLSQNF